MAAERKLAAEGGSRFQNWAPVTSRPRDVGGGGRLEGLELGAADEQVRKACSHETLAAEGGSRV